MSLNKLPNQPSLVEYQNMRFLIMDAPSESTLPLYIKEMEKHSVKDVVRVCEATYSAQTLENMGIKVCDWFFSDGDPPPANIVNEWLDLVSSRFAGTKKNSSDSTASGAIAIHCVAGLGRAPVLVAIALIEAGMSPLDAVAYIRERRRGAINNRQLKYLESYKRRRSKNSACLIM